MMWGVAGSLSCSNELPVATKRLKIFKKGSVRWTKATSRAPHSQWRITSERSQEPNLGREGKPSRKKEEHKMCV